MPEKSKDATFTISTGSILKVFFVGLLFFLIYYLRDVVLVILTSIVLASFVQIAADRMTKYRINRTLMIILIYASSVAVLASLFYLFFPILLNEASDFSALVSGYLPTTSVLNNLQSGTLGGAKEIVSDISGNANLSVIIENIKSFASGFSGGLFTTLSLVFGGILNLILIFVISFYLSIQEKGIENFLRLIIPLKHEDYVINLWNRSKRKIALWVRGQLLLGLLVGVLMYLGLSILGVRYSLLLALTAGIFELIPFGIFLAAIPGVIFAYLDGGIALSLMSAGLYLIVQQFEAYLIQPLIIKKAVGISPLVVIVSLLVGFELAGFWGIILAIPVAVVLLEFTNDIEKNKISAKSNV